jgi:hypothetical protein
MTTLKTTLITSIGTLLIGAASAAPILALGAKAVNSDSIFRSSNARTSAARSPSEHVDLANRDPDAAGYLPLGTAKIDGRRVAINVFQNGATLDDTAGQGKGVAEVYDRSGHLVRRFVFRENRNSPPLITEFVYTPER